MGMLTLRQILFWVFALIYLLVCPVIILYSLGLIINPDTQEIDKTGIIYVSSIPTHADVYLGAKRYPEKTPTIINLAQPSAFNSEKLAGKSVFKFLCRT